MKPLYIWAGGKSKMIKKYLADPSIPLDGYDTFVEPFFGGGAMMVWMHKNNKNIKRFIINDINAEIVGIYRAIKDDVQAFISHMDLMQNQYLPLSKADRKAFYLSIREIYTTDWQRWTATEESATLYFLMKTGFNGIWQTNLSSNGRFATPSGLLDQTDKVYDRDNVLEWHDFLQKVEIHCGDWRTCVDGIDGKAFYFMDPPYRDSFTQYGRVFGDDKHIELIDFCKQADQQGHTVFYCNRQTPDTFYDDHRAQLSIKTYDIKYTAGRRSTDTNDKGETKRKAKAAVEILLHSPHVMKPFEKVFGGKDGTQAQET